MTQPPQRDRLYHWIDRRMRGLLAGLGLVEVRTLLRGDEPVERPNPRYKAHTTSFVLHIRPRFYPAASTWFSHTFRLGFFAVFLFVVEVITGLVLMLYYVPTPEGAYPSILRLLSLTSYGELLRDTHRLAAEGMVIFVFLHMLRTFLTASYKRERSFTWVTGVILLVITLAWSFSGYLLPWDQLAYWAVTIGTSMVASAPLIGEQVNLLVRGGQDIGADGLLRFYQLHVFLLPVAAVLLVSVHYYQVARKHGISLPARVEEGDLSPELRRAAIRRIDWLPDLFLHEVFLACTGLLVLIGVALAGYDAPLERHADPWRTPIATEAPWFFLWVQGLLKLGDKTIMGVAVPAAIAVLLLAVPTIDRNPHRRLRRRPVAVAIAAIGVAALGVLTFMGTARYGISLPPAVAILQEVAPDEGAGQLHRVPFDDLAVGVYPVGAVAPDTLPPSLAHVFGHLQEQVLAAANAGDLPEAQAYLIVEDWQQDLKRVTLRIMWTPAATASGDGPSSDESPTAQPQTLERVVYLHRNRSAGN